jgi:FtsP/CotA-like multicopper oxidase with cupredoxin domain
MKKINFNRRSFLKAAGLASLAVGVGAGAGAAGVKNAKASAPHQDMTAAEMDAAHEKAVKTFLANIGKEKDFWGPELPFKMDGNTKVFDIVTTSGPWNITPDQPVAGAMQYNGRVPGATIRVTQGDNVRVNVTNKMPQSTTIHFHGVHTPNTMDGVGYVTQPPIKNGETFTYEFVAKNAGTHMYHSHHNSTEQVTLGMMAPFIIDPVDKSKEPQVTAEYMLVLNDTGIGFTINGRAFPYTQPIVAAKGDKIRLRYMNEGLMIHPMHLHGMYQQVIAIDGATLTTPYLVDTVPIAPGTRYDTIVDCEEPGVWAFHCHILSHAESPNGLFGMTTALVIK